MTGVRPSMVQFANWLDRLRGSFWFLPTVMSVIGVGLSFTTIRIDDWIGFDDAEHINRWIAFSPEGARSTLSAIASSMITVAGITFSVTMLTLQLASSQYGPRLLPNFMSDRGNQIVLGTFIATFLYCLLVLRVVRGTEDRHFVPDVAVLFGIVLAIASLAVLIYFIHHTATSIRIETQLALLAADARRTVDRLFPNRSREDALTRLEGPTLHDVGFDGGRTVAATAPGYVQRIDEGGLMDIATEHDLVVRIDARPGRFVAEGDAILTVCPPERLSDSSAEALAATFVLGWDRTPHQDLEYSIRRLVEIAQRALSPGTNDPTTALYCLDRLLEVFGHLAGRAFPSAVRLDEACSPRVVAPAGNFADLVIPALTAIARYGLDDCDVMRRLLGVLRRTTELSSDTDRHRLAAAHASLAAAAIPAARLDLDRQQLDVAGETERHDRQPT